MSKKDTLIQALDTRYPLLGKEAIASTLDKLFAVLRTGKNTDFEGEPLRVFASPVEYFFWVLDFNHAGRKNYEYLLGDRALAEKVMDTEPPREAKHDPSRNGYQKKYQKKRYHERMTEAKKILGGKCTVCGATESLELDHKSPGKKKFNVSKLWSVPEAEFKREVKKCRLLCRKHHLEHTGKQRENGTVKSKPGKSSYGDDNRKKASFRLELIAKSLGLKDAAKAGAAVAQQVAKAHDVEAVAASAFNKQDRIGRPVVTWNVFEKEGGGSQVLFRVYGHEKDSELVQSLVSSVKEALKPAGADFEYEDDLSEPGLLVKTVSGICH